MSTWRFMEDINSFYNSILNLRNTDYYSIIKDITADCKHELFEKVDDLSGFCKLIASQIEYKLKVMGITTYYIDLHDFVNVDHVVLIAEYKANDTLKRVLIDPTKYKNNNKLLRLNEWPSIKINDRKLVDSLLSDGVVEITNDKFNMYINGFSNEEININLDDYLLKQRFNNISSKIR